MGSNQAWDDRQNSSDEARRFHEQDRLAVWVMDEIAGIMDEKKITKAELARKIGCSRSYITQIFSGSRNPTLATIADLAWALDLRANFKFEKFSTQEFISAEVKSCKIFHFPKRQITRSIRPMSEAEIDLHSKTRNATGV